MSVRSLTTLAVARDKAAPAQPASGGGGDASLSGDAGIDGAIPQQFIDVLVSAIPTEPLAAFVAIVGITSGTVDAGQPRAYLPYRWGTYAAFLVLTVVAVAVSYNRKALGPLGLRDPELNKRPFPWSEGSAALIAAAAWGLAMPGSALNIQLGGAVRTLTSASITIGAAAVLALLFAPELRTGTKSPGESPSVLAVAVHEVPEQSVDIRTRQDQPAR